MKASIHMNGSAHQQLYGLAMRVGLERHGVAVVSGPPDAPGDNCDFAVIWGVRKPQILGAGIPVLVMERGYVGDRMEYTSCGWDGLNGRARFPVGGSGARWLVHFGGRLLKPWRKRTGNIALLCGQVSTDAALLDCNYEQWLQDSTDQLGGSGWRVLFRPHPLGETKIPRGAEYSHAKTLATALAKADLCVTLNSNAGVDAVLAGIPTVAMDEGSMAWAVTAHEIPHADAPAHMPNRIPWAHAIAWTQWTLDEIAAGTPWPALNEVMPRCQRAS